jgi:putative membrane-bound dehydrogenase-like protein
MEKPSPPTGSAAHFAASERVPPAGPGSKLECEPIEPGAALRTIQVPEGYTVDLVAAEPLVIDPVAFDWDTKGRLWVVEMFDYPLGLGDGGAAGGRIRVLEDEDGDGLMDRSSLFADGLNFPNGILTWRDGIIVTAAPEVLFLRDTDGDGKADDREALLTGLTEGNQQLRANGLRWGLDNWVYVAAGGHHGKYGMGTTVRSNRAGTEVKVGSRDFRFRPDTGELEPQSGPTQFGRNRDDWGRWFGTQNSRPLWHYVLPDHYLRRNPHYAAPDGRVLLPPEVNPPVYPAKPPQKRFHGFQQAGRYTSACSGMIYRDDLLFPEGGINGFSCENFHNLVQRIGLTPDGVTFSGKRVGGEGEPDFFASTDRWCRPVMVRTGPDGALWIADMYRYMIEHPQWLPQEGKDELLPFYREGDDRGRIYRVRREESSPKPIPSLEAGDPVGFLASSNGWLRDKAQQVLLWKGDRTAVPALEKIAAEAADPRARLQAFCTLDGLDALSEERLLAALGDAHPGVRINALRLAETRLTPAVVKTVLGMPGDPEPSVQLQLAFTLGELPPSPAVGKVLAALLQSGDPFLGAAAFSSALPHFCSIVEALPPSAGEGLRRQLCEIALSGGDAASFTALAKPMLGRVVSTLELLDVLAASDASIDKLEEAGLSPVFQARLGETRAVLSGGKGTLGERITAASLLARLDSDRHSALAFLAGQVKSATPPEELKLALTGIRAIPDDAVSEALIESWPGLSPSARTEVLGVLLSRREWTARLLGAVESGMIRAVEIDPTVKMQLQKHPDKGLRENAVRVLESSGGPNRAGVVTAYASALTRKGDAGKGLAVYQKACLACHRRGSLGQGELGPDLVTVTDHPPEKLLANILDPNRDIQPGYHAYHCELKGGEQLFGLIAGENATGITLKQLDGVSRTVRRADIVNLKSAGISLMPDGLEATITETEMADLIAFLKSR